MTTIDTGNGIGTAVKNGGAASAKVADADRITSLSTPTTDGGRDG